MRCSPRAFSSMDALARNARGQHRLGAAMRETRCATVPPRHRVPYTAPMLDEAVAGVLKLSKEWAFPVSEETCERVANYLTLLLQWNQRVNLTGARELRELLGDHLPDSFALARLSPQGASVVDIGSGGGLPSLPFAILRPDCHVTMVEPRAKRIAFLNMAVRSCACDFVKVVRGRLEDLPHSAYLVAASRATFSPQDWLQLAPELLVSGGIAVVFAVDPVDAGPSPVRLVDSIQYRTASGTPRWSGSFCFT